MSESGCPSSVVYRASGPQQPAVCHLERPETGGRGAAIYTSPTVEAARAALGAFAEHWGEQYPAIVPGWERNWECLTPFFGFPPEIRRVVYTTNAIESLNYSLRKIIKGRGVFPHDDAIWKLLYRGLKNASKKWTMGVYPTESTDRHV